MATPGSGEGGSFDREVLNFSGANFAQRALRQFVASAPGSWLALRVLPAIDKPVARVTGGKHTATSLLSGLVVVFLTTKGARSGEPRRTPVLGFPTEGGIAVIASNYGQPKHPAWYHNLRATPEAEILLEGQTYRVRARETEGEERERIWQKGLEIYPGWETYQRRAPDRRLPVLLLEPL